jgi:putative ABC transport system permease protein
MKANTKYTMKLPKASLFNIYIAWWRNPLLTRKLRADLIKQRGSFFMVWVIFVLGLTFYSSTYPAGKSFEDAVKQLNQQTTLGDLWVDVNAAPASVVEAIKKIDGVKAVTGRLVLDMGFDRQGSDILITLRTISVPESEHDVNNIVLTSGRIPSADNEIALIDGFATVQNIKVGDIVQLHQETSGTTQVQVVGLISSGEYLIPASGPLQPFPTPSTFGVGYMPYHTLASLTNLNDRVNNIVIQLEPSANANSIRESITALLQAYGTVQIMDHNQFAAYATLNANLTSNTQVALVFAFVFLFGSGTVMSVLLARHVESERRTIGTLRALGCSRFEIVSYYLVLALIIAITGAVVAIPAGHFVAGFMIDFFQRGMIGASIPFSTNNYNWPFLLFGIGISASLALLSAIIPSWQAATTDPGLALRPPSPGTIPWLARIPIPAPLPIKQGVRDLLRVPGRSMGTIVGTMCGLTLIVLCFAVWNTIDYNFDAYYRSRDYDFTVTLKSPTFTQSALDVLNGLPGITGIESGLIAPIQVQLSDRSYTALGIVLDDHSRFITFETLAGVSAFSNNKGVWLGHNLSRTLNAHPGDTLTISAQGMTRRVKIEGIVKQVLGAPMYIPRSLFNQWVPLNVTNQLYIRADPAHRNEVQRALNNLTQPLSQTSPNQVAKGQLNVIGVEDWRSTIRDLQRVVAFNNNNAVIFLVFGLLLTFVVLFNSITSTLQERHNELAIMRMQGVSIREIARIVNWQIVLTVTAGIVLGILPSLRLVDYTMQAYNTDVAGNLTVIYPMTWVIAISILAITAFLSKWLPMRRVRLTDLGKVSKSVGV